MGRLSEINAQIESVTNNRPMPKTDTQHYVEAIVGAIKDIQLNIEANEGYDYTPEIQKLGEAVTEALKVHGDALVKALSGVSVNVEAPTVNVEAPSVTVNPEIEIEMPPQVELEWNFVRDSNGLLTSMTCKPLTEERPVEATIEME